MGLVRKKKKTKQTICLILALLIILYLVAAWLLLKFALVPNFTEKFNAFEKFTKKGYSEQVYTDDILKNTDEATELRNQWLETVNARKLAMESEDGYQLIALEFLQPEENKASPWVIPVHGYTGRKSELYSVAYYFYQEGFNVLVPDLRAQGESEGKYIGMGYLDKPDLKKWMAYINHDHPGSKVVLFGESMGATAVLQLSAEELPDNVVCAISDAAFRDPVELFKYKMHDWTGLPDFGLVDTANLLLRISGEYNLHDAAAIKAVESDRLPTLFIQGTDDKIVTEDNVYDLYDNCKAPYKDILVVEGAGHCQSRDKNPEEYYSTIFNFIDKYM